MVLPLSGQGLFPDRYWWRILDPQLSRTRACISCGSGICESGSHGPKRSQRTLLYSASAEPAQTIFCQPAIKIIFEKTILSTVQDFILLVCTFVEHWIFFFKRVRVLLVFI